MDLSQDFELENSGAHLTVIRREWLGPGFPPGLVPMSSLDRVSRPTNIPHDLTPVGGYIPVTNRGYMWQDSPGNIYIAGGYFFSQPSPGIWGYWEASRFHLPKQDIPDYSIWRYDIRVNEWTKIIPGMESKYPPLRRLASSGYISIPSMNLSYCFGYVYPQLITT